mmetsp:Transcript_18999/g.27348  ORF Transcript_18999/g.27348 Transcript_18999/m.27348 type:complete len:87 (+) Transcript_18999:699-959(+)
MTPHGMRIRYGGVCVTMVGGDLTVVNRNAHLWRTHCKVMAMNKAETVPAAEYAITKAAYVGVLLDFTVKPARNRLFLCNFNIYSLQ